MAKQAAAPAPKTLALIDKGAPILLELSSLAVSNLAVAEAYTIDSREMYDIAAETLGEIRAAEKRAEEEREKITKPLHQAKTAAIALFKPYEEMLGKAKRMIGGKMVVFEDQERARVRAAEQTALLAREQEIAATTAKLEEATVALSEGKLEPAAYQEIATEAMLAEVALPMTQSADPVERGGHARVTRWTAEVLDLPTLLEHLAKLLRAGDPTFDNTVDIKLGQLQAFARDTQGRPIPGVKFTEETSMTARAR